MTVKKSYTVSVEPNEDKNKPWTNTIPTTDGQAYTYDEAIDVAGNGFYSWTLLATLNIATLSMAVDIFGMSVVVTGANCDLDSWARVDRNGFYSWTLLATLNIATLSMAVDIFGMSVVVTGANCDLDLDIQQTGILLSICFLGPIVMAYPWGYISDTQGRRKSLLISLWTSFLVSAASAFSPNWITLAVLKLISTSFSSCAQSVTYTLLGESCPQRYRDTYMVIMGGVIDFSLTFYVGMGYLILNMDFSYDLGFIAFTPWRLLTIVLSLSNGLGAFMLLFFYESPKFLLNAARDKEALNALAGIWRRNGGKKEYPVKKVTLTEIGNVRHKNTKLLRSLWEQIVPLFKPPLLSRSLQLFFLIAVVYSTNNSYFAWFPYLAKKLIEGASNNGDEDTGLCNMIVSSNHNNTDSNMHCSSKMDISLFWSGLIQGVSFVFVIIIIASMAHRKRFLVIVVFLVSGLSGLGAVLIKEKIFSFIMFLGLLFNEVTIGILFSYYVDLFPTSFRGMAACLGTMVARGSALGGVSLLGNYILSNCSHTFYVSSALMISGVFVAFLLPKDKSRKPKF